MNTNPRQLQLLEEVRTRKSATVEQLADTLGVTLQTVRRDVQRLAEQKARAGLARLSQPMPVLGADTIVVADNQILGKPANFADFNRTMQLLSGRCHQVMTALALVSAQRSLQQLEIVDGCLFGQFNDHLTRRYAEILQQLQRAPRLMRGFKV